MLNKYNQVCVCAEIAKFDARAQIYAGSGKFTDSTNSIAIKILFFASQSTINCLSQKTKPYPNPNCYLTDNLERGFSMTQQGVVNVKRKCSLKHVTYHVTKIRI